MFLYKTKEYTYSLRKAKHHKQTKSLKKTGLRT